LFSVACSQASRAPISLYLFSLCSTASHFAFIYPSIVLCPIRCEYAGGRDWASANNEIPPPSTKSRRWNLVVSTGPVSATRFHLLAQSLRNYSRDLFRNKIIANKVWP